MPAAAPIAVSAAREATSPPTGWGLPSWVIVSASGVMKSRASA